MDPDRDVWQEPYELARTPTVLVRVIRAVVVVLLIFALLAYFVLPSRTFTSIRQRLHIPSRIRPIPLAPKHNPELWSLGAMLPSRGLCLGELHLPQGERPQCYGEVTQVTA